MNDILFGNSTALLSKKKNYPTVISAGKSRNIIAVYIKALTTILFTTIFTLGSGLIDTVHDQNIQKTRLATVKRFLNYISDEVFDNIKAMR